MKKKYDFYEDLAKEQNPVAQQKLAKFYDKFFKGLFVKPVPYENEYGKYLQHAGVDKILFKKNVSSEFYFVQEKVCSYNYPMFIFEYQKMSGDKGWAINSKEKSDMIVYYLDTEIAVFRTPQLRKWLLKNFDMFVKNFNYTTDNYNFKIPKNLVYAQLKVDAFNWKDEEWKRKAVDYHYEYEEKVPVQEKEEEEEEEDNELYFEE